jgi:hypothetical protein
MFTHAHPLSHTRTIPAFTRFSVAVVRFTNGATQQTASFSVQAGQMLYVGGLFSLSIQSVSVLGSYGDIPESGTAQITDPRTAAVTAASTVVGGTLAIVESGPLIFTEPASGMNNYTLTIARSNGLFGPVDVRWIIATATPPTNTIDDRDFASRMGVLSLAHAQTSGTVVLSVLADDLPEFNESFGFTLIQVGHCTPISIARTMW